MGNGREKGVLAKIGYLRQALLGSRQTQCFGKIRELSLVGSNTYLRISTVEKSGLVEGSSLIQERGLPGSRRKGVRPLKSRAKEVQLLRQ
jgi:hypothetical protein